MLQCMLVLSMSDQVCMSFLLFIHTKFGTLTYRERAHTFVVGIMFISLSNRWTARIDRRFESREATASPTVYICIYESSTYAKLCGVGCMGMGIWGWGGGWGGGCHLCYMHVLGIMHG